MVLSVIAENKNNIKRTSLKQTSNIGKKFKPESYVSVY